MPKKTPIINDFRAGELTPDMDTRIDLKDYYRGCRTLENAMPIIEGGVARVPGTYYVRPVKQIEEGWSLRVTKSGTGIGVVTSDVAGIDCGSSCYYFFPAGTTVVLTGTAGAGSGFTGWSGEGFSGIAPISVLMDGDKVINAEFGIMLLGMFALHMILDSGILYMVGRRNGGVLTPYTLCISKYIISGTSLSFIERKDYEGSTLGQQYYCLSIYNDFIYVTGRIVEGGSLKSFVRKINKNTLNIVWTYISHVGTGNTSYSMVSPKLYEGAIYWGNFIGGVGGQAVKLNDADGSETWKITSAHECFEVEIGDATHVDFIGDSGGIRKISRRLQTTGAETSSLSSGNYWFQKTISDATHYWIASRFLVGDIRSTLTKINKPDLTVDWNANFNFSPTQNELFYNVVTDGSDFYCLGLVYVGTPTSAYRAVFGKVNAAGTPGVSLQHSTKDGFAAIIVTADYVFAALYDTFECRSKVDLSLIATTGI